MQKGTCKHFNGCTINKACAIGVKYADVTPKPKSPGTAYRIPCKQIEPDDQHAQRVLEQYGGKGTCPEYTEPTDAEIEAFEAEVEASMQRFELCWPLVEQVKREHKGQDWKGSLPCPACSKGQLNILHFAHNGHVHARCSSFNCLAFME